MCNRYRMTANQAELAARYGIAAFPPDLTIPPPELFPKRAAWTIREQDGVRTAEAMAWGFPITIRGKSGKPIEKAVTNVRNYASPFWRSALKNPERRCLVAFTEFCEWEGETGSKLERWFYVPSQPITSFAGVWRPTENGPVMAFLTTEPNPLVAPIHPKAMPVLLAIDDELTWLFGSLDQALALAAPFPSQLMTVR
ncbi:SOS response-associated peptidase [Sphingomonas baiyangensis]|uniref:Abasic site processing protein n=1 Tax=Sphingomonas baiyangensis TaxID=2572576 RepID=A0A4U1L5K4_9SPHN|nr:SOS response-associated peptidase family protein [Sphingomonas baiyangensis]TKD51550.1 DUF159 family protein [Sphingomonas baiyangensis]